MDRWRSSICTIALETQKKFEQLAQREQKLLQNMRKYELSRGRQALENKYKLDAMQIDSRRWPDPKDLDGSVTTDFILPQTMLNNTEYQKKLSKLAFYAEQADYEAVQKVLDSKDALKSKNMLLQPIYRQLKTCIRRMNDDSDQKILREYYDNRLLILKSLPAESQKANEALLKLKDQYKKLYAQNR